MLCFKGIEICIDLMSWREFGVFDVLEWYAKVFINELLPVDISFEIDNFGGAGAKVFDHQKISDGLDVCDGEVWFDVRPCRSFYVFAILLQGSSGNANGDDSR